MDYQGRRPGTDLGYPWSTQLADNTILTVYYMTSQRGLREIGVVG